jgi:hypothetical protein
MATTCKNKALYENIQKNRKLHTKRRKTTVETLKQTARCVRLERVNKWSVSMLAAAAAADDDDNGDNGDDFYSQKINVGN